MACAELPDDLPQLRASIEPDEPAITISMAHEQKLECLTDNMWTGTLQLPENIAPGTYELSESPPSLYVRDFQILSCMGSQSYGIDMYATGTVTITSVAADCLAGEIDAETVDADDSNEFRGAFAAEPRM